MFYRIVHYILKIIVPILAKIDSKGVEFLQQPGSFIVAGNHIGVLESFLVWYYINRHDVILMVAKKYESRFWARWLGRRLKIVFADQNEPDFTALRTVLRRLKDGGVFVVTPEGTRSKTGALMEPRIGVGYIAARTNLPIVPAAVTGTQDWIVKSKIRHFRRARITVTVGNPFKLQLVETRDQRAASRDYTDEIMCRIAVLLPPEYRGLYADHPRTRQLMEGSAL